MGADWRWAQIRQDNQMSLNTPIDSALSRMSLNPEMPRQRVAQDAQITEHVWQALVLNDA